MNKYIKYLTSALTVAIIYNSSVLANPSTLSENSNTPTNNAQGQNVDSTLESKIQKLEVTVEKLDSEIEETLRALEENKTEIAKVESEISRLENRIKDSENSINDHRDLLKKRARAFYVNGLNGYLDIIMNSENFNDFITRIDSVNRILNFDENIIEDLNDKKEIIVKEKEKLQEKNKLLTSLKVDNEKKLDKLNKDKEEQKKLIEQLQLQLSVYNLNGQGFTGITSKEFAPASNNEIVNYAYNFLGIPYLWGGTTPSGFDCSGLVQYIYSHFGVSITRTTYEQIKDGVEVQRDKLQPGDLVFFGTKEDPHHVGMYIGDGRYIHAPRTGDVVKISSLSSRGDYLTARRIK